MAKGILNLKKDEFVKGSIILFLMMNAFMFLNYLFHFSMARMLGPADYGILAVLMSIGYIFGILADAIQNIISKYTSKSNIKKEYGKINNLLRKGLKKGAVLSLYIFIIYLAISIPLALILKIDFLLLALTGVLIFSDLLAPISRGVLQGIKRFGRLGINMILEGLIKVIFAFVLVLLGLKVYGAMSAVIISVFAAIFIALFFLRDILKTKEKKCKTENIKFYSFSFIIAILSITLMFSVDIILARLFFSPEILGKYAVASILGKMIFFGTVSISKSLFPFSSESHEKKEKTRKLLNKALGFLSLICIVSVLAFALFPKLIILILFGKEYLEISNILIFMGLSFSVLSFTNLFVNYALSKDKQHFSFYLPIFVLIEISLLSIFSISLMQYAIAFLVSNILMLIGTVLLIKNEKRGKNGN